MGEKTTAPGIKLIPGKLYQTYCQEEYDCSSYQFWKDYREGRVKTSVDIPSSGAILMYTETKAHASMDDRCVHCFLWSGGRAVGVFDLEGNIVNQIFKEVDMS